MALRVVTDYLRDGSGMLAMTMVQVMCGARSDPSLPVPDLQMQFAPFAITRGVDENGMFNVQPSKEEAFLASSTFLNREPGARWGCVARPRRIRRGSPTSSWPTPTTCATSPGDCVRCSG
jgi:choline dehydrogenase